MEIRKGKMSDAKGIAKVHVDSWRTTYVNIVPDEYLKEMTYESREQLWNQLIPNGNVFVAEDNNGKIVGFASGGRERSNQYEDFNGELYAIYLLEEYQRKGIGKLLFMQIVKYIQELGYNTMIVLVLAENPSCLFYEALGGRKIDALEVEILGKKLVETVYGWEDIRRKMV
ncbi:L-amino acid N-acyltransferase YncA [Cytobacillus eiseniae]|uniref:L-amino acid N-acyltransferase YncA n=1 Tax=Cytobacillus eiseniae TaxID=762947 RepID=A0ABS4RJ57_9BACI|nr:GNAT family N-acetyltransferase [Cytobacillus eiseniae]MBP2242813.1 L-amino acid N-acyltransferase YncA [Cytobacillus eiseniae]